MPDINILVVDDEKEIADLIEIYLVSDGYKVYKANNAMTGLEILEQEEIHLVLLDIMMPGMDGLTLCRRSFTFRCCSSPTARANCRNATATVSVSQCFRWNGKTLRRVRFLQATASRAIFLRL